MIIGIGNDLIDIRRVEKTLERHGERFTNRLFTPIEQAKSDKRRNRAASYAKRFAAKEACSKALGTGLSKGVFWRDMGVVNLPTGQPTMALTGGAAKRLAEITRQATKLWFISPLRTIFPWRRPLSLSRRGLNRGTQYSSGGATRGLSYGVFPQKFIWRW